MAQNGSDGEAPVIHWFRDDLRLFDNPALTEAAARGRPLIALYVLDEGGDRRPLGGASRWWLHNSLAALGAALAERGVPLIIRRGDAETVVPDVVTATGANAIFWGRRYDLPQRDLDARLKRRFEESGIHAESQNTHLLIEPWKVRTQSGSWFKVFTPFWKAARAAVGSPRAPLPVPTMKGAAIADRGLPLEALGLLPVKPDWAGGMRASWTPGEAGARARLGGFVDDALARYADKRDFPDDGATSNLSPHLRFGEISLPTVWQAAVVAAERRGIPEKVLDKFLAELGWREFAHHLLFHFPTLSRDPFQPRFADFPWADDQTAQEFLKAWQKGETGYPIVDAGMRQLWETGTMHNRVRMVVASFLAKHLLIDWRQGEAWFWDTLCDACPANNPASWQWVAGSGADAAPYFRIFNPVAQGERFDPDGAYVKRYVPELARLPAAIVHRPWTAEASTLRNFGVGLGRNYPAPIVVHEKARDRALAAFEQIKTAA